MPWPSSGSASTPDDDEALTRVVNVPKRGIGDTTVGSCARPQSSIA